MHNFEGDLVTISAIGRALGVTPRTARQITESPGFPHPIKVSGPRRWYLKRDVVAFLDSVSAYETRARRTGTR